MDFWFFELFRRSHEKENKEKQEEEYMPSRNSYVRYIILDLVLLILLIAAYLLLAEKFDQLALPLKILIGLDVAALLLYLVRLFSFR